MSNPISDWNTKALQPAGQLFQLASNVAQAIAAKSATEAATAAMVTGWAGVVGATLAMWGALLNAATSDVDHAIQKLADEIGQLELAASEDNICTT